MHIRTKFDGGKFQSLLLGSWHTHCYAGGLTFNNGPKWSPISLKKNTQEQLLEKVTTMNILTNNKYKCKPENKLKRWKRKIKAVKTSIRENGIWTKRHRC